MAALPVIPIFAPAIEKFPPILLLAAAVPGANSLITLSYPILLLDVAAVDGS